MRELPSDAWEEFHAQFQRANERLAGEMAAAGKDLQGLIEQLRDRLDSVESDRSEPDAVASFEWLFRDAADQLFCDPLGTFENLRPVGRTLSAIEQHRLEMTDLVRTLPQVVEVSGAELVEFVGPDARARWRKAWLKRRKSPRPLRLRQIVMANLWAQISRRARIDEAFERVLARTGLHLVAAWQLYCRHQLAAQASGSRDTEALAEERKWWLQTATTLTDHIEGLVRSYRDWAEVSLALLGRSVLSRTPQFSEHRQNRIVVRWENDFSLWSRQHRAVRGAIDLDRKLIVLARETIQTTQQALESLRGERCPGSATPASRVACSLQETVQPCAG